MGSRRRMEMRMSAMAEIGRELTPPLPPLASSLHDSHLRTHCSACFSPLPPDLLINSNPNTSPLRYCSPQCLATDSHLHFSTAEHHLFLLLRHSHPFTFHFSSDSSDLRAALRLLHLLPPHSQPLHRIRGLLTNLHLFNSPSHSSEADDTSVRIRDGGRAMALARCLRDGVEFSGDSVLEEALLCLVLTNAVEVQVNGGPVLGIAVYDWCFSWINHSCSPNACYRFLLYSPETPQFSAESRLLIFPPGNAEIEIENAVCNSSIINRSEGCKIYGPRIAVRSIKAIKEGEEVSVAYIDLLQPKAIRQAELWDKYRFICCCGRCIASPPHYVDLVLQGILDANLDYIEDNTYRQKEIRELTDYIDDAITNYLSVGDSEACCEKLEKVLSQGLQHEQLEQIEGNSQRNFRLHPLHHLSVAAYTTLASAYKVRASHLLDLNSEMEGHELEALQLSKASAAYSLLLAGATHHLFLSESSLIASVANFWMNVGESLLSLARSSVWNFFVKRSLPVLNLSHLLTPKCHECSLMDQFEANLFGKEAQYAGVENTSREFHNCLSSLTPTVWGFLIQGCHHIKTFENPIDFSWVGTTRTTKICDFQAHSGCSTVGSSRGDESSGHRYEEWREAVQERTKLLKLGVHCLLYGGYLSNICYGPGSYSTVYIRNLVHGEENPTD